MEKNIIKELTVSAEKYNLLRLNDGTYTLAGISGPELDNANKFLVGIILRGLSIQTMRSYGFDLVLIFKWLAEEKKEFEKITQRDLLDLIAYQKNINTKPRSINRRLTTCESFFNFSYDKSIPRSPFVSMPASYYKGSGKDKHIGLFQLKRKSHLRLRVKVPKLLIDPLKISEINQFLKEVQRYRDIAVVLLMLSCGLRSCEVLSLKTEDLDLIRPQIRIKGKGNKERVLPLSEHLVSVLTNYLTLERPDGCDADEVLVILQGDRKGMPMTKSGLRSLFRHRRKKLNITNANPHSWRHAFATDMARIGVPLPVLQKMMGHEDYQSLLQYINLTMVDIMEEYQSAMLRLKGRYEYSTGETKNTV
ncbi:MAG: tyrosine-type recombinase/integrase [Bacteriovorax sp.]|nr:tyrosine-type recombinase/integrase [Bacteriovorax sp.]